jgi:hypothetical protein
MCQAACVVGFCLWYATSSFRLRLPPNQTIETLGPALVNENLAELAEFNEFALPAYMNPLAPGTLLNGCPRNARPGLW